jgi:hypothetical protein
MSLWSFPQPFTVVAKEDTQLLVLSHKYFTDSDFAGVKWSKSDGLSGTSSELTPVPSLIDQSALLRPSASRGEGRSAAKVSQALTGWVQYHLGSPAAVRDLTGEPLSNVFQNGVYHHICTAGS